MFEVAELGRKLDKATFKTASADVRTRLLIAQQKLRNAKIPVIVVVSGVEGAGKTDVVNRMSEWLDTRGLQTHSFWEQSDDERRRPPYWRFWRRLPPRGTIGVMFGSWYTQPILDRATDQIDNLTFDASMHTIARFERLLSLDGALIVKLWLHLPKKELCDRIDEDDARGGTKATSAGGSSKKKAKKSGKKGKKRGGKKKKKHRDDIRLDGGIGQFMGDEVRGLATEGDWSRGAGIKAWNVSPLARKFAERYEAFAEASERAIRATDSGASRWHLIEATDRHYRDLTAAQVLLDALEHRLLAQEAEDAVLANGAAASPEPVLTLTESAAPERAATPGQIWQRIEQDQPTILDSVDLTRTMDRAEYKRRLAKAQRRLFQLSWQAWQAQVPTVCVFEGWDAAGKGGAIRRLTTAIDARLFRTVPIAAPTDEEAAQHYLWRFWRQLPVDGRVRIYDRSWYGRVLVERVEGFCSTDEWMRSYQEITDFEEELVDHGVALAKFWLHISPEEQLRRFKEREVIPWKKHKITAEDWRNREKWPAYEAAIGDMVARTSTVTAPWTLVPGNDKKVARVHVVETVVETLERALKRAEARR